MKASLFTCLLFALPLPRSHQEDDDLVRALDELAPVQTIWGPMWTSFFPLFDNIYMYLCLDSNACVRNKILKN